MKLTHLTTAEQCGICGYQVHYHDQYYIISDSGAIVHDYCLELTREEVDDGTIRGRDHRVFHDEATDPALHQRAGDR